MLAGHAGGEAATMARWNDRARSASIYETGGDPMRTASCVRLKRALISLSALLGVSFPAFAQFTRWPPGSGDTDYSIAADGAETFLNTPALHGSIHVRAGNNFTGGELNGYLANFSLGNFSGGPPDTSAVRGRTTGAFPVVGVYGTSTAPDHGVGMQGVASGASSTGVFGQGDFAGLQGFTTAANGFGTSGVASGTGGHAIDAICNGACATGGGLAGNFQGDVVIGGPTGLTLSTGDGIKPGGGMWKAPSDARLKKDVTRFEL